MPGKPKMKFLPISQAGVQQPVRSVIRHQMFGDSQRAEDAVQTDDSDLILPSAGLGCFALSPVGLALIDSCLEAARIKS
jgi:hypothetical protein